MKFNGLPNLQFIYKTLHTSIRIDPTAFTFQKRVVLSTHAAIAGSGWCAWGGGWFDWTKLQHAVEAGSSTKLRQRNTRSHEQQQQQLLARFGMRRRRNARELRILTRRRQKGTVPPHTSAQDGRDVQRREGATVELAGPAGGAARAARPRGGRAERGGALALRHRR